MFIEDPKPMPVAGHKPRFARRGAELAHSDRHPPRLDLNRMFEENEILTQIRALRQEVGSRLDDMDQRLQKIEADLSSPAMQGFGSRLEEMDLRLRRVETHVTAPPVPGAIPPPAGGMINSPAPMFDHQQQQEYLPAPPPVPTTTIQVTINPLHDVSRVRVVEAALVAIQGVEAVSLQTLSGDTAELQVEVQEDVSLIGGLRRTLPLAFDVSESDLSSFTIALAQPVVEPRQNDVVTHKAP
jgi:hypothetical protein